MTWYMNLFRMFFTFLDRIVYQLISWAYELLLYLANLDLFGISNITDGNISTSPIVIFSSRIYAFLGIFMLFRVSFSILQYMINPDDFSDKGKGFGKLVRNVLTSLILVVAVPFIFSFALDVQKTLLNNNILGKLILGETNTSSDTSTKNNTNAELAEDMKFLVYSTFVPVNIDVVPECEDTPILGTKAMGANKNNCLTRVSEELGENDIAIRDFFGIDGSRRNFDRFGDIVLITIEDEYMFDYMPLVTTAVGGLIAVWMIGFCIDVAVRVIKLAFLEMIAPVPIISYIDPNQSGKDGMLSKWAKECFSTYLSLFIRLAIIYFAFYVIDLISGALLSGDSSLYLNEDAPYGLMSGLVVVMVIIGLITFCKQVPKLLEEVFGIKNSGSLTLNPLKNTGFSRTLGLVGGAVLGGVSTMAAAAVTGHDLHQGQEHAGLKTFGSAVGGLASGVFRGGAVGVTSDKIGTSLARASQSAGRTARNMELRDKTTWGTRAGHRLRLTVGAPTKAESLDNRVNTYEAVANAKSDLEKRAREQMALKSAAWQAYEKQREALAADTTLSHADRVTRLQKINDAQKNMVKNYINSNGKAILGSEDYEIINKKIGFESALKDVRGGLFDPMKENLQKWKDNGNSIENLSFDVIQSFADISSESAARIKNTTQYNDAHQAQESFKQAGVQGLFQGRKGNN